MTTFDLVHLSDLVPVAMFHGLIGSIVWGLLITLMFVISLILRNRYGLKHESPEAVRLQEKTHAGARHVSRRLRRASEEPDSWHRILQRFLRSPLLPAILCTAGGFIGGLLCAIPSVLVTNVRTLYNFGWINTEGAVEVAQRLRESVFETQMFFAFPLTGALTGCGLGLFLYYAYQRLLRSNPDGLGLVVVPIKQETKSWFASVRDSLRLLASPAHLWLLLPLSGFAVSAFVLNAPRDLYLEKISSEMMSQAGSFSTFGARVADHMASNAVSFRALGEGLVHYFGAVGLAIGFYFRVPMSEREAGG
jgi:hypothetical protein